MIRGRNIFTSGYFWGGLVAVLIGSFIGLGVYTFSYGEGLSYFSKDPQACVNCHIMQPQFDSWQKASHHTVATCVDCHLPHETIPKLIAKSENGFWHSKGFTLQDFHEPIFIREKNTRILQENCLHCHSQMVHDILPGPQVDPKDFSCVHCHRSVGHGPTAGLGKYEPVQPSILKEERSPYELE
ncbi:MAG: cytochrome c nitrite reductase small subunit [Candidatus Omnitrophica bacterium]|nr:cytochrome c nitrite reductase small subunit [Candidatus Omnitrophota bacterium]